MSKNTVSKRIKRLQWRNIASTYKLEEFSSSQEYDPPLDRLFDDCMHVVYWADLCERVLKCPISEAAP